MKLCFISYARNSNLDGRLGKFVEKLEQQIPAHLPHGARPGDIVFFDVKSIDNAEEWMERLSEATRCCKVCVCFYSPPYFTSEYSGREVQVFLKRLDDWKKQPANAEKDAKAIIPVIWVPHEPIPTVLKPFQYTNAKLPALYAKEGLLALAMRKNRSDAYNAVLYELARGIAASINNIDLPVGTPILKFDAVASAFHDLPKPTRYGVSLFFLVERTVRLKPFSGGGKSLDVMLEGVANRCKVAFREVKPSATIDVDIAASLHERELPIIVADRATLESPLNAPLLNKLVQSLDSSATVVLIGDPSPNAADATSALRDLAVQCLAPWSTGAGATAYVTATDPPTFDGELEKRLLKARHELVAADPAARADDLGLQAAAKARGIDVENKPILSGPWDPLESTCRHASLSIL